AYDTVVGFDATVDKFDWDYTVTNVVSRSAEVNAASVDSNFGTAIGDGVAPNTAVVLTASSGDLAGHKFLVGVGADQIYISGTDYVIDITGFTGTITTANFT